LVLPSVTERPMLWQAQAGMRFRLMGGWFYAPDASGHVHDGPMPTVLDDAVTLIEQGAPSGPPMTATVANAYRGVLQQHHVRAIVVTPQEPNRQAVVEFFTNLTGTPPLDDGHGTSYWISGR
jgi:hypothetical protein